MQDDAGWPALKIQDNRFFASSQPLEQLGLPRRVRAHVACRVTLRRLNFDYPGTTVSKNLPGVTKGCTTAQFNHI